MERKIFGFGSAASLLQKGLVDILSIVAILRPSFPPSFAAARRAPSPRLVIILVSAHTSQTPRIGRSHSLTMACSVLASCSLYGFGGVRGGSKKADCAKLTNGTNKSYCA